MRIIRHGRPSDWRGAARINVAGWRYAYRGAMDDAFLDAMDPDEWSGWRARRYGNPLPGVAHLVELSDGDLVGYGDIGPSRSEDDTVTGELYAIYLDPDCIGTGLGRPLIRAARRTLEVLGHRRAELWVLDSNERARRFYEADGWRHDGEVKVEAMGGAEIVEARYTRDLP